MLAADEVLTQVTELHPQFGSDLALRPLPGKHHGDDRLGVVLQTAFQLV